MPSLTHTYILARCMSYDLDLSLSFILYYYVYFLWSTHGVTILSSYIINLYWRVHTCWLKTCHLPSILSCVYLMCVYLCKTYFCCWHVYLCKRYFCCCWQMYICVETSCWDDNHYAEQITRFRTNVSGSYDIYTQQQRSVSYHVNQGFHYF